MALVNERVYYVTVYAHEATQALVAEKIYASTLEKARTRFALWCQADKYYAASLSSDDGKIRDEWLADSVELEHVRTMRTMRSDFQKREKARKL